MSAFKDSPNVPDARTKPLILLALVAVPVLLVFVCCQLRTAEGPPWLTNNLENNYAYLLNSLNVANLRRPYHTDHPGTSVQVAGALVLRAMNPSANEATMAQEVLANPDRYIHAINNSLIVFCALSVLLAGYAAFNFFRSVPLALLVQAGPFLSGTTLRYLTYVGPEALVTALSMLVVAAGLFAIKTEAGIRRPRYAAMLGVVVGIGIAAKLTFVPVAIVPLVLLASWRTRAVFSVATVLAFLASILPILTIPQLHRTATYIATLATHTGTYGRGSAGLIAPRQYLSSMGTLMRIDVLFCVITAAASLLLLWRRKFTAVRDREHRLLLAVTVAQLFQIFLVAKHPANYNLIPSLVLSGLTLALVVNTLAARISTVRRFALPIAACLVILLVQLLGIRSLFRALRVDARCQLAAYENIKTNFSHVPVVTYYTASSPYYALAFGTVYNANLYGGVLQKIYPNHFFYFPWTGKFSNFAGPVEIGEVIGSHEWFILSGCSLTDPKFKVFLPPKPLPDSISIKPFPDLDPSCPGVMCRDAVYQATVSPVR